jgi:hypothetical protein
MANEDLQQKVREIIASAGRPALGAIFPNEFEVYMLTFALTDSDGAFVDYFSFPVMPSNMQKTETSAANVKRTLGGVVTQTSPSWVPQDLTISGDFGRNFKILVGRDIIQFKAFASSINAMGEAGMSGLKAPFNVKIKNGYGCTKVLQKLLQKSTKLDEFGYPYKLYIHNPVLGESHLVQYMDLSLTMDENSNNRMWRYNIRVKLLADANKLLSSTGWQGRLATIGMGVLQNSANILAAGVGDVVRAGASDPIGRTFTHKNSFFRNAMRDVSNNIARMNTG